MDIDESSITPACSADFVRGCIQKRQPMLKIMPRSRMLGLAVAESPTRALDALVLGNSMIGYGDQVSLENMAIIENIITMSKMEANFEVPGNKDPKAWYHAFTQCMEDLGCFVPDKGFSKYNASSLNVTMDNIVVDIVNAAAEAAKAAVPGASVLSAITSTTLNGLKSDPEAIKLLSLESKTIEGMRLSTIPCEQMSNGIILVALAAVDHQGDSRADGVLFFDWKISTLNVFHGKAFATFNPARYSAIKTDIEEYLGVHRKEVLVKRFSRRK